MAVMDAVVAGAGAGVWDGGVVVGVVAVGETSAGATFVPGEGSEAFDSSVPELGMAAWAVADGCLVQKACVVLWVKLPLGFSVRVSKNRNRSDVAKHEHATRRVSTLPPTRMACLSISSYGTIAAAQRTKPLTNMRQQNPYKPYFQILRGSRAVDTVTSNIPQNKLCEMRFQYNVASRVKKSPPLPRHRPRQEQNN